MAKPIGHRVGAAGDPHDLEDVLPQPVHGLFLRQEGIDLPGPAGGGGGGDAPGADVGHPGVGGGALGHLERPGIPGGPAAVRPGHGLGIGAGEAQIDGVPVGVVVGAVRLPGRDDLQGIVRAQVHPGAGQRRVVVENHHIGGAALVALAHQQVDKLPTGDRGGKDHLLAGMKVAAPLHNETGVLGKAGIAGKISHGRYLL